MKIIITTLIAVVVIGIGGCSAWFTVGSSSNREWLVQKAPDKWEAQGYKVIDYEGYQWGFGGYGTAYGGAKVWHRLERNGRLYSGWVMRWGEEVHVYGPTAVSIVP